MNQVDYPRPNTSSETSALTNFVATFGARLFAQTTEQYVAQALERLSPADRAEIDAAIVAKIKDSIGSMSRYSFEEEIKTIIRGRVNELMPTLGIEARVETHLRSLAADDAVRKMVDEQVGVIVREATRAMMNDVDRYVRAAIERRPR